MLAASLLHAAELKQGHRHLRVRQYPAYLLTNGLLRLLRSQADNLYHTIGEAEIDLPLQANRIGTDDGLIQESPGHLDLEYVAGFKLVGPKRRQPDCIDQ